MSSGYRLLIVAACGLTVLLALATGAFFGSLYAPDHKQYQAVGQSQSRQNDYRGPSDSLPDIAGLPSPVERAIANPRPATGADHEKRDLAAQEASALWAFWITVASFASLAITTVGTILLYQQIILTREAVTDTGQATAAMIRANEIAEKAVEFHNRAWITVQKIRVQRAYIREKDAIVSQPNILIQGDIIYKNVGNIPTSHFSVKVRRIRFSYEPVVGPKTLPVDFLEVENYVIGNAVGNSYFALHVLLSEYLGGTLWLQIDVMYRSVGSDVQRTVVEIWHLHFDESDLQVPNMIENMEVKKERTKIAN